jgi:C2 domain
VHDTKSCVHTTAVVKKSLNPTWDETFEATVQPGEYIEFRVMDQDKLNADDFLGTAVVGPAQALTATSKLIWMDASASRFEQISITGTEGFPQDLPLHGYGGLRQNKRCTGELRVKIEVLNRDEHPIFIGPVGKALAFGNAFVSSSLLVFAQDKKVHSPGDGGRAGDSLANAYRGLVEAAVEEYRAAIKQESQAGAPQLSAVEAKDADAVLQAAFAQGQINKDFETPTEPAYKSFAVLLAQCEELAQKLAAKKFSATAIEQFCVLSEVRNVRTGVHSGKTGDLFKRAGPGA